MTLVLVDPQVMDANYGRVFRSYWNSSDNQVTTVAFIEGDSGLGNISGKTVVMTGTRVDKKGFRASLDSAKKTVLLNPALYPQELGIIPGDSSQVRVIFGEFSQSRASREWDSYASVRRIDGVGNYIAAWPKLIFDP